MLSIFLRRILLAIPVLIAVASITFFLVRLAPGGPFDADKAVSEQVLKNLNEAYNLNAPLSEQYFDYMTGILVGDFGPSFRFPGRSVTELIMTGLPVTFELAIYSMLIALFIGIYLELLPVSGWGQLPGDKILPSLTLGFAYAAYIARLSRGGMLEILNQDFIRTARAKGLSEKMVVIKHAMQGGLIPVVSFLGPAVAGLLAGSFVVETIFQIPGLGRFYVEAAFNRDYTMILGTTIFFSFMIVFFNLLSDIVALWLNPRSRDT